MAAPLRLHSAFQTLENGTDSRRHPRSCSGRPRPARLRLGPGLRPTTRKIPRLSLPNSRRGHGADLHKPSPQNPRQRLPQEKEPANNKTLRLALRSPTSATLSTTGPPLRHGTRTQAISPATAGLGRASNRLPHCAGRSARTSELATAELLA